MTDEADDTAAYADAARSLVQRVWFRAACKGVADEYGLEFLETPAGTFILKCTHEGQEYVSTCALASLVSAEDIGPFRKWLHSVASAVNTMRGVEESFDASDLRLAMAAQFATREGR